MKLYVWADPYFVSYGTSMLLAVAESEDAARAQAMNNAPAYKYAKYAEGLVNGPRELGAPTRVVELPCAEWHEWSE